MRFSSERPGPVGGATAAERLAVPAAVVLVVGMLLVGGCAHARGGSPSPAAPGAPRREPPAQTTAGRGGGAPSAALPPGAVLDPAEEITPEELATIPEPVEAYDSSRSETPAPVVPKAPTAGQEPRSDAPEPSARPAPGSWIWSVQILATPDRSLAERVARESSDRLGATSNVVHEASLYKVRLGEFTTEADAQELRLRAIDGGYPGAFRVRSKVGSN